MPHRTTRWLARAAIPVVLAGIVAPTGLANAALAAPAEGDPWVMLAETDDDVRLNDISLAAEDDGWVIGRSASDGPYAAHWDGKALKETDLGELADRDLEIRAVDAVASDDVWAMSSRNRSPDTERAYVRSHWDGEKWTHQDAKKPEQDRTAFVYGLRAFASDDVWAIGTEQGGAAGSPFADHYDGTRWTRVDLPEELTSGLTNPINDVGGVGGDDVWIVGSVESARPPHRRPYAAHWDGTEFTTTELPVPDDTANYGWTPEDVMVSGGNVWVSGQGDNLGVGYKYDGKKWTPWKNMPLRDIDDMSADPKSGRLVAVGNQNGAQGVGEYASFDGSEWTIHPQAQDAPDGPAESLAVAQAPDSGNPMGVGYIDSTSFLTAPAE